MKRIAVIQVRGGINMKKKVKDTLNLLRLYKKNSCSIISDNPSYIGMLDLIKDFITWGELNKETCALLLKERGRLPGNTKLSEEYIKKSTNLSIDQFADEFINNKKELKDVPGLKSFFRLKPPVHGFEKKGIKNPFSMGGALGYRKEKINELIKRMV